MSCAVMQGGPLGLDMPVSQIVAVCRTAFGQDGEDAPTPGRKPPTPKRERYLPSFSRSPLRPRQPSPTPAPEPLPRPAPRELSPGSWKVGLQNWPGPNQLQDNLESLCAELCGWAGNWGNKQNPEVLVVCPESAYNKPTLRKRFN